jgi:NADH:ubiquinone oxidoreductase subunit K
MQPELNTESAGDKPRVRAAQAAAGRALIIAIYRHYKTTKVDEVNSLKG